MSMGDYSPRVSHSQSEIAALKEALSAQQRLLQKLYQELEAEREASATAASEALSVILRLQGEKAAVKMEAEQYKRLAEEKMCHAEESFAVIEDVITQKEMEMADLDYQLQTYKYQLMSYGIIEPDDDDIKIPDNLMHRNDDHRFLRRNSAPLLVKSTTKTMVDGESTDLEANVGGEMHGHVSERKVESSYADQIRELELRVIGIAGEHYASLSSQAAGLGNLHETKCEPTTSSSSKVHDVFEVPQADDDDDSTRSEETGGEEEEEEDRGVHSELVVKSYDKNEPDWLKKLFHSTHHNDKNLCKPSDIAAAIDRANVSESPPPNQGNEITEIQRVGEELIITRDEEMKLLKDIREKLIFLQHEIKSRRVKEPPSLRADPSLRSISEAMVWFWL